MYFEYIFKHTTTMNFAHFDKEEKQLPVHYLSKFNFTQTHKGKRKSSSFPSQQSLFISISIRISIHLSLIPPCRIFDIAPTNCPSIFPFYFHCPEFPAEEEGHPSY